MRRTLPALAGLVLGLMLVLTGCGEEAPEVRTSSSGGEFNSADVTFATEMIQHHAQALSMVDLTLGRSLDSEVQDLAEDIRAARTPEIEQLTDWLRDWDEPVPETVRDHANAHGDGHAMDGMGDMPGMMSAERMQALEKAPAAEFQQMWLQMMIEHHEGAVEMARTEQANGVHAGATRSAESIERAQRREIETMKGLL